ALMGKVYAQNALGILNPKVGLVTNGEEAGKGTQLIQEAADLISQLPVNYIGNIEPKDIHSGRVDVVVTDGFTGNVMIKTFESTSRYLVELIRKELTASLRTSIGALLARPAFSRLRAQVSPDEIG